MKKERSYEGYTDQEYQELEGKYIHLSKECDELTNFITSVKNTPASAIPEMIKEAKQQRNTIEQQKNDIRDLLIEIDNKNSKFSYHSLCLFSDFNFRKFNYKANGSLIMPSDSIAFRSS